MSHRYHANKKAQVLAQLYDYPANQIVEISANKFKLGRNTYRVHTLHQLATTEPPITDTPDYKVVVDYDEYHITHLNKGKHL